MQHLFATPPLAALEPHERLTLRAARLWVMLASRRDNPRPALERLLGSGAGRFGWLMERLASAWPDAFTTYPCCATTLSSDESTLVALLRDAATGDAREFDTRLSDLLGPSERRRLWDATRAVVADGLALR